MISFFIGWEMFHHKVKKYAWFTSHSMKINIPTKVLFQQCLAKVNKIRLIWLTNTFIMVAYKKKNFLFPFKRRHVTYWIATLHVEQTNCNLKLLLLEIHHHCTMMVFSLYFYWIILNNSLHFITPALIMLFSPFKAIFDI